MTQLPMTISNIEDGIISRIRAAEAAGVLGYRLKKLDTYGGEFADGLERMRDFPAILVIFGGADKISQTNQTVKFNGRFGIICAARNLRSEATSRKGHDAIPGSYKIMQDAAQLLIGQTLGIDIGPISVDGFLPLFNDKSANQLASVYAVNISTVFELGIHDEFANPDNIGDFETFHANWDIPPHGNVEPPPPDDDNADATDHVTLPVNEEEEENGD